MKKKGKKNRVHGYSRVKSYPGYQSRYSNCSIMYRVDYIMKLERKTKNKLNTNCPEKKIRRDCCRQPLEIYAAASVEFNKRLFIFFCTSFARWYIYSTTLSKKKNLMGIRRFRALRRFKQLMILVQVIVIIYTHKCTR